MVDDYNPVFAFISESNLWEGEPEYATQIDRYEIIKPKSSITNISRIILLVKSGQQFKLLPNLMHEEVTSIWVKVGSRSSKLILGGIYREHSRKGMATPVNTESDTEQHRRWGIFMEQWKEAADSPACVVIGDTNLDKLKWQSPEQIHIPMIDRVKEEIETRHFIQVIQNPTRFWSGQTSSLIDQAWLNCTQRLVERKNTPCGTADHNLVSIVIKHKGNNNTSGEHMKRDMKGWNTDKYISDICNINSDCLYRCEDIDLANNIFEEKVTAVLEALAPLKKVQNKKHANNFISKETRDLMTNRDLIRETAVKSQRQEDWDLYRRLWNRCNQQVKNGRCDNFKKMSDKLCEDKNSAGLYRMAKNRMGWAATGPPISFVQDGKLITSPVN